MSTLVVAEKPSVARDIARVLGARRKGKGCLEGSGYRVTWALGHLVHFAEPDDYGEPWSGRWSTGQLPMIPDRWRLKTDRRTAEQYKLVKGLLNDPDTTQIVCATDAGREGELIFRLIYEHARCRKPVERLWVSSLTDEAIGEGFRRLRPGADFDPLAAAARARAQADWLVGMNLTRAYTVHNRVLCIIGRVQTPTLAMIVARDAAIASFTKAYYYELLAHLAEGFSARYARDGETRIDTREEAERLHRQLVPHHTATVREVKKKVRRNRPPPLYDLTNLQRDANRRFGLTAAETLTQAQALYETHKLISYPRTESRHISEDMVPELPGILSSLEAAGAHPLAGEARERLAAGHTLGKAYVDRTRLTDHHAILPTDKAPPSGLTGPLRQVYDLVVTRFVAVFLPDQQVEETRATLDIGGATFLARGALELDPGWTRAMPRRRRGTDDPEGEGGHRPLPPLTVGRTCRVERLEVQEKETEPPRPYDDATLLAAMKNAGRSIEDEALAEAMKASGLGTPATRAETIEKLIRTGYVERRRKQLLSTDKGRALIGLVATPLRSPELTAEWEQRLKDVELGSAAADAFYQGIVALVWELLPQVAAGAALTPEQVATARTGNPKTRGKGKGKARRKASEAPRSAGLRACPLCGQGEVTVNAKAYGCSRYREGCGLTVWRVVAGREIPEAEVRRLLAEGVSRPIEGFRSKAGRPFTARLRLGPDGRVGFDFSGEAEPATRPPKAATPPRTEESARPPSIPCPRCGQGRLIEGRRGYGCNRYREGCDFVVWKEQAGHQLDWGELQTLISTGRLGPLPQLQDGQGRSGTGWLRLGGDGAVVVERLPDPA